MKKISYGRKLLSGVTEVLEDGRMVGHAAEVQARWAFYRGNPPGLAAAPTLTADTADQLLALIATAGPRRGGLLG